MKNLVSPLQGLHCFHVSDIARPSIDSSLNMMSIKQLHGRITNEG